MSRAITPDRWRQVDQLLDEALELDAGEIPAFLAQACGSDIALRREVESLLSAHGKADGFIEAPPQAAIEGVLHELRETNVAGQLIGRYRVLGEIGRGGMGIVYKAVRDDDEYKMQVAIKLVWTAPHNTQIIKRFRQERQILANLDHPNIARLLDGGTSEQGVPYVVMEYIEGQPITDYCRAKQLSITARLQLFREVCAAVQYAHQALVIHRDLKPSNILVTAEGNVKLLDFGIAKLIKPDLSEEAFETRNLTTGSHLMTPEYASPEQVRGEVVTTASDVYSLGIVLYELLTGGSPYQFKNRTLPEIISAVNEQEPLPPSEVAKRTRKDERGAMKAERPEDDQASKQEKQIHRSSFIVHHSELRGDLDIIVLTALRKEVQHRYQSVEQLSEDIHRHLTHQPIAARNPTLAYRVRKLVRRQRLPLAAAALLFLTLLGGIFATTNQARIARRARATAESSAQDALHQRALAEVKAVEALEQKSLAEANATEADRQRLLAEAQTAETLKQQQLAEAARAQAEAGEASFRRLAYGAEMHLGAQHWDMANISGLSQVVNHHIPKPGEADLRGFEWYYLWRLLHRNGEQMNLQHNAEVWAVAYSPDGKTIATGHSESGDAVKLWDATNGTLLSTFQGKGSLPWSVVFSSDGKKLAGAFNDGTGRVWDVASGQELLVLTGHKTRMTSIAFSPDGKTLVTGSDDEMVKLWDAVTGGERRTLQVNSGLIKAVAFSPDGKLLATGGVGSSTTNNEPKLRLWNPATGQQVCAGDRGGAWSLVFSPDGTKLITADGSQVKLWKVAGCRELMVFKGHNARIRSVTFAPNGKYIASASEDRTAKLWESETGRELATLRGHRAEVWAVAFSPDSRSLVTGATDFMAKVWDVGAATEITNIPTEGGLFSRVTYAPDGTKLATAEGFTVAIRDAQTGRELVRCQKVASGIAYFTFSPDSQMLATANDKMIRLWDANSGQELAQLQGHTSAIMMVAFSPDGRKFVSGGQDQTAIVWEVATGRALLTLKGHSHRVISSVAFSPDGSRIATGSHDKTVKLWDATTGKELATFSGQVKPVLSVAISPDGKTLAAGSADTTVKLWELATGRELVTLTGSAGHVKTLAFSPDGSRLATGSGDGLIRLWNPTTGQELMALKDHLNQVNAVAFSPDGKTLASAAVNSPIRLWRAASKPEVLAWKSK